MGAESKTSKRRQGREVKAIKWAVRHPGALAVPSVPAAATSTLGVDTVLTSGGWVAGGVGIACVAWYRGHPDTFDRFAAPVMRAWRRRWVTYIGLRWKRAMEDCHLFTTDRRTGEDRFPRLLRVRSYSPTIDTLFVKMARGQALSHFENRIEELTVALKAERVALEKIKPRVIGLIVQRCEPFTEVIPAPDMPGDVDAVDLSRVYIGDTEDDTDCRISVAGDHVFIAGATGAGKNSIPLSALRAIAPMIRAGLVRLWLADPKQSEFAALRPIAYRYSAAVETDDDDEYSIVSLITEYRAEMEERQRQMAAAGQRSFTISAETPLDLLILDEIGAITAYSDIARLVRKDLAVIITQGRAAGKRVWGLVQEPTKDTVPIRDLFTLRICLRVTASSQVDMVLGENARLRGALADEIPNTPATAGIGYVMRQRSRVPQRIRAAYVDDTELGELVGFVRSGHTPDSHLKVVA